MSEAEIIAALRSGDPRAVGKLVELYGERLLRSAYVLCGNEADAQDLVQDTLIVAMKSGSRFRGRSALYTWLHGILLNLTRSYQRKRRRIVYTDELPKEAVADLPGPGERDMAAAASILSEAIQRLSPRHREVIVLRYYEGMKIGEIAAHTGVRKGTVTSRLHYAKRRLRELIPQELNLFGADDTYDRRKP